MTVRGVMARGLMAACMLFAVAGTVRAQEHIVHYDSRIVVGVRGEMDVTETITVVAAGIQIQHGIYREFPTIYRSGGMFGSVTVVPFVVREILLDGQPEVYHTERRENGIRVYVGSASRNVAPGQHVYTVRYTTNFQVGYFADHDELYWNVTGNGWVFPILAATATVTIPHGDTAGAFKHEGYVGPQDSRDQSGLLSSADAASGTFQFTTTRPLNANEGLTLVASFPKGIVGRPNLFDRIAADPSFMVGVVGLGILLCFYFVAWMLVGRDPPKGTIFPLYDPPQGLPPGQLRYVDQMSYDAKCFTAAILRLAVTGHVRISEAGGTYSMERGSGPTKDVSPLELRVRHDLLGADNEIRFTNKEHATFSAAIKRYSNAIEQSMYGVMFETRTGLAILGALGSVIVTGGMLFVSGRGEELFFAVLMYGFCMAILAAFVASEDTDLRGMTFVRWFAAAAVAFVGVLIVVMAVNVPLTIALFVLLLCLAAAYFTALIKQPSVVGRKLMDEVEGFRMYLRTAEGDRLNAEFAAANPGLAEAPSRATRPPLRTIELFERYLPYALALGVENEWGESFADVVAAASSAADGSYHPSWYSGSRPFYVSSMGSSFASMGDSLSSSISASATAPGSSSGSSGGGGGGGGSSGGGGGGGGGGGW